jgi:cell pole-organizing protein PopZ
MSDPTAQEPTMEEILASIRRIISEDDAPAETAAAPAPAPEPAPAPAPAPEPAPFPSAALMDETPSVQEPEAVEEDILELTDTYEAPAVESIGDLDVSSPEPEAPTAWTPRARRPTTTAWSAKAPPPAPPRPSPACTPA